MIVILPGVLTSWRTLTWTLSLDSYPISMCKYAMFIFYILCLGMTLSNVPVTFTPNQLWLVLLFGENGQQEWWPHLIIQGEPEITPASYNNLKEAHDLSWVWKFHNRFSDWEFPHLNGVLRSEFPDTSAPFCNLSLCPIDCNLYAKSLCMSLVGKFTMVPCTFRILKQFLLLCFRAGVAVRMDLLIAHSIWERLLSD